MPATEQTWRNLKILHVVFAVAALLLLLATVLMLTADHARPWKKYARGFRNLETWSAAARVQEQGSQAYADKAAELDAALADARRADLEPALTAKFIEMVKTVPADVQAADLAAVDLDQLRTQTDPQERLVKRGDLLARFRDIIKRARYREDQLAGALKLRKAELDKNRADYELAVTDSLPAERQAELLALADAKRAEVATATLEFQSANTHRKSLEAQLGAITAGEDAAAKAVADHRAKLGQLEKTLAQRQPSAGKAVLELPVLDAFNGPLKVDQIWLPDLTLNNNFRNVARFDRCTTCHRGMDKTAPGSPTDPAYCEAQSVAIKLPTPAERPASSSGW